MSSSLLPACLVRLIQMVLQMGGNCLYSCRFEGCCSGIFSVQLLAFLFSFRLAFFSIRLVSVYVVYPFSSIDTTAAWKNCILFYRIGKTSYIINNILIAVHTFARRILPSFLVDETFLQRYMNLSINF